MIDPATERVAVDSRLEAALGEMLHLHIRSSRFQTPEQAIKACVDIVQQKIRERHAPVTEER